MRFVGEGPPAGFAGTGEGMADGTMPFFADPLKYLLARNLQAPKFDEETTMWPDFVWEWDEFWAGTTVHLHLSDPIN